MFIVNENNVFDLFILMDLNRSGIGILNSKLTYLLRTYCITMIAGRVALMCCISYVEGQLVDSNTL